MTLSACSILAPALFLACAAPPARPLPTASPAGGAMPVQETVPAEEDGPLRFGDPAGAYEREFFPGAVYDPEVPHPEDILGRKVGSRLAHHAEIVAAFRALAGASDRVTVAPYGTTHEGRELVHAVITSPANHARLEEIRRELGSLFDPRELAKGDEDWIVETAPAVAWMGYSIHGDELSGADASLAVAYHLIASQDEDVVALLDKVVVVMDPCMNPDGRERIVAMIEQTSGRTPNLDYASMHRGQWPYGRGNHYLFDMNRDWMTGTQPETRGRWALARSFHPQLFIDAHEMWSLDTFLFYPQNRPLNPQMPAKLVEWQRRYAEGAAAAFDRFGWSYYTREWADAWAPFYSDSWGSLIGATGMLYEQGGTYGTPLRRRSGEVLTYRESVHHQVIASMANLGTLRANRQAILADYVAEQRRTVAADTPGNDRVFVVPPGGNLDRRRALLDLLRDQGIEAFETTETFQGRNAVNHLGQRPTAAPKFPVGSIVVPTRQPLGRMVKAYFEFDPRMPKADLERERSDLERKGNSNIYDLTAWSIPHAFDLPSWWCDVADVEADPLGLSPSGETRVVGSEPSVAWIVSGAHDSAVSFAARAMEYGLAVHAAERAFEVVSDEIRLFPRGSLLVRAIENGGESAAVEARVLRAAREAGVAEVHRAGTGLAPRVGPDLGGGHFQLLSRPRLAILTNAPVAPDMYGHLWYHLDTRVGVPFTLLDAQRLGGYDLRRYNVLLLPPGGGLQGLLEPHAEALTTWIEGGGTLIACADAAAAVTQGGLGLSSVTLRRDALEDLGPFLRAAQREWDARSIELDERSVWGDPQLSEAEEGEDSEDDDPYAEVEVEAEHDRWLRTFAPYGVTLRGLTHPDSFLTYGAGPELPVFFSGSHALLSKPPVQAAVRLAPEEDLRLGGLVWPEARERLERSAWLTREAKGRGQVILFAAVPAFRGYHTGTGRLLSNAVVLGPGLGASQPDGW